MRTRKYEIGKLGGDGSSGKVFPPLSMEELLEILGLTIKEDETNKLITFLCQLSAYTEDSQFNVMFNAPSSTGKSYIPNEIASLFPQEDIIATGYCSPTAFFHDYGEVGKDGKITLYFGGKILIFLDQPHTMLLQHLRPVLSHDRDVLLVKITDRQQSIGLRTKNIAIDGFPAVIFCSAGLRFDEQEATRSFLLSPEVTQEKIRAAIDERLLKESNSKAYSDALNSNPMREQLRERIRAIRDEYIEQIVIGNPKKLEDEFYKNRNVLRPRHPRDIGRVASLVKVLALLNLWHRERKDSLIVANDEDIDQAMGLWNGISICQELSLPPYVYNIYLSVILPFFTQKSPAAGITRRDIIERYYQLYERPLADWQLRREILPMLEMVGLIFQEPDPDDKRRMIIRLTKSIN